MQAPPNFAARDGEIDTSATIEVHQSPWKLVGLTLAFVALIATCAFVVFGPPSQKQTGFATLMGWFGLAFFGFGGIKLLWRVVTVRGPTLVISPQGLHDVRVSARPIPWTAVRDLRTWGYKGQKILVVDIDPEVEKGIGVTRTAAWTRAPNRKLGADGLCVTSQDLKITYARLFDLACAYARAHGSR